MRTLGDGAQRQDLATGRNHRTSRPVHAALQTWSLSHMWGPLSHMWGPNRHGGRAIPAVTWIRGPPWSWSLHSLSDYDIALNHSKNCSCLPASQGFHHGSDGKESACNSGALGSISGSGRFLGEGNGYPLQYSCLEDYRNRGAWQATVHGVSKRWT